MEPIIPARLQQSSDIKDVFGKLAGYRVVMNANATALERTSLCVYVLPGGTQEARGEARAAFKDLDAWIVDTELDAERDGFLHRIRELGAASGTAQLPGTGEFN